MDCIYYTLILSLMSLKKKADEQNVLYQMFHRIESLNLNK